MEVSSDILPYRVFTDDDSKAFRLRLNNLHDAVYQTKEGQDIDQLLQNHLLEPEYKHLTAYAKDHTISLVDSQALQSYLASVIAALDECEALVCKVAFPIRYAFGQRLLEWFAEHVPGCARVTFVFTPDILGGFVIEFGGRIYDQSLALQLAELKILQGEQKANL